MTFLKLALELSKASILAHYLMTLVKFLIYTDTYKGAIWNNMRERIICVHAGLYNKTTITRKKWHIHVDVVLTYVENRMEQNTCIYIGKTLNTRETIQNITVEG